jgi:hypothetical protein
MIHPGAKALSKINFSKIKRNGIVCEGAVRYSMRPFKAMAGHIRRSAPPWISLSSEN